MMPPEEFYRMIGKKIELLRKSRKMTRGELAGGAGISEKFLYEIERKGKGVSAWTLYCISNVLDVRMDVFMEIEKAPEDEVNSLIENLSEYRPEEFFKLIYALNKFVSG
ncbi:MAG: helix-turn-helix domain-containing protein [Roseburia sp.]|nr:helix-turn-helix domain-containing protein [Roseburia sp.]